MQIRQINSPNHRAGRGGHTPDHIVIHTTGGGFQSAINTIMNPANQVSYHFVISRAGEVVQAVDISNTAWANGTTNNGDNRCNSRSTLAAVRERRVNANSYSISIGFGDMPSGNPSPEHLRAAVELIKHIRDEVQRIFSHTIPFDRLHIVGHDQITPITRPHCPSRNFPWGELMRRLENPRTPEQIPPAPPAAKIAVGIAAFAVGAIVQFTGGGVYTSSRAHAPAHSRGASICRVTQIAQGAPQPLHLVSTDGGGVHGWVAEGDVKAIVQADAPDRRISLDIMGEVQEIGGYIENGTTYVVLRDICAALGYAVTWDEARRIPVIDTAGKSEDRPHINAVDEEEIAVADADLRLLKTITHWEARGEDEKGQILVVNVIKNRLASGNFPNTLNDVIFMQGAFTPTTRADFHEAQPNARTINAVHRALNGEDFSQGATFFHSISGILQAEREGRKVWHEQAAAEGRLVHLFDHGNHRFYKQP